MYRDFLNARALPIAALIATSLSTSVLAQSQSRPDPAQAGPPAPAVEYQSVFSRYQPFQEQKGSAWKEVNKDVADNPGMGPMPAMKGMASMDAKGGKGEMAGMAGHGSMAMPKSPASTGEKGMPGMAGMPGHGAMGGGSQAAKPQASPAAKGMAGMSNKGGKGAMAGMNHGSMAKPQASPAAKGMAGMSDKGDKGAMAGMNHGPMAMAKPEASAAGKGAMPGMADHGAMPMAKPQASAAPSKPTGPVSGTGVIQQIDKANGKVKMTHEPIDALGWPGMTMVFRLKDGALADKVKEGDKLTFTLEKSASGYVISSFGQPAGGKAAGMPPMDHHMGKGEKK